LFLQPNHTSEPPRTFVLTNRTKAAMFLLWIVVFFTSDAPEPSRWWWHNLTSRIWAGRHQWCRYSRAASFHTLRLAFDGCKGQLGWVSSRLVGHVDDAVGYKICRWGGGKGESTKNNIKSNDCTTSHLNILFPPRLQYIRGKQWVGRGVLQPWGTWRMPPGKNKY
jgi:hypothetical protein